MLFVRLYDAGWDSGERDRGRMRAYTYERYGTGVRKCVFGCSGEILFIF